MKTCKLCGKTEPEVAFEHLRLQCKACRSVYRKTIKQAWYARNVEYARLQTKQWRELNAERKRTYRKQEYARNAEAAKEASKEYRKANRSKVNHWSRMRQCAKASRVPKWLTADDKWMIEEFYDLAKRRTLATGFAWQVDHIIPLRGKLVSGLHVPSNLQVIPEAVNKAKRNHF